MAPVQEHPGSPILTLGHKRCVYADIPKDIVVLGQTGNWDFASKSPNVMHIAWG
jgi:hypothetical protein